MTYGQDFMAKETQYKIKSIMTYGQDFMAKETTAVFWKTFGNHEEQTKKHNNTFVVVILAKNTLNCTISAKNSKVMEG